MSKIYRVSEFAKRVNCGVSSLRQWDNSGKFPAKRTMTGQRYYTEQDVRDYLHISVTEKSKVVVYVRVSSASQKQDMASQRGALENFCAARGYCVDEWVEEIGGGLNFKRKKFLSLFDSVTIGGVNTIIIAHKDRLVRFGFDYFEHVAAINGCKIVVMNQEKLSPQAEMVEDLLAIVHTFSCRLYGLRKYKKTIREDIQST